MEQGIKIVEPKQVHEVFGSCTRESVLWLPRQYYSGEYAQAGLSVSCFHKTVEGLIQIWYFRRSIWPQEHLAQYRVDLEKY